jgi:hypothetical protein
MFNHCIKIALLACMFAVPSFAVSEERPLRFIALDGGGFIMQSALMTFARIEHSTGKPIAWLVDGFLGMSSGAIIAAKLCAPKEKTFINIHGANPRVQPKWSAAALRDDFAWSFPYYFWASSLGNSNGLAQTLQLEMGHGFMSDAISRLMIASYNTHSDTTSLFDSNDFERDLHIWNAAQSSVSIGVSKFGIEWSSGPSTAHYKSGVEEPGWIDPGFAPSHRPMWELLATKLSAEYPHRKIFIYSFGHGYEMLDGKTLPIRSWKQDNVEIIRFQPDYRNETLGTFQLHMILPPVLSLVSLVESYAEHILHSPEYLRMVEEMQKD